MGFGTLRDLHGGGATPPPTAVATLRLEDVDGALSAVERMRGGGSGERRVASLRELMDSCKKNPSLWPRTRAHRTARSGLTLF